jgi:peptide/nickel transport system substrate-binding protein
VAPLELLTPAADVSPVVNATARKVADAWRAIGLDVTLTELPAADFVDRIRGSDYQAAVVDVNIGLDPDLFPLLASSQSVAGGSNVSGYQNPALDSAMTRARQPGPLADRKAAFSQIQKLLVEQLPILPLYFRDFSVVAGKVISGIEPRIVSDPSQRFSDVVTWRVVGR